MRFAVAAALLLGLTAPARAEPETTGETPVEAPDALPTQARVGGQLIGKPRVRLGEPFEIVLTLRAANGVVIRRPDDAELKLEPFEVVKRDEHREREGEMVRHELVLTVVVWELGSHQFPSIPLHWVAKDADGRVETDPLTVEVEATVAEAPATPPADIAPPVAVTQLDRRVIWAGVGVAAALALAALGWVAVSAFRRRRRRLAAPGMAAFVDTRPPEEIALARLAELASGPLLEARDRRVFYFVLTEIEREYLGRRFGFGALELTTSEVLAALERLAAPAPLRDEVRAWLEACDLVKYAGVPASREEAVAALERAVALVEKARPQPVVAPPAESAEPEERRNVG